MRCTIAPGWADKNGYRRRYYQGRQRLAHRARFHEVFGWWPPVVRHTCDTPGCDNIWHLVPGTHADNMRDMVERGGRRRNDNMPDYRTNDTAYRRERRRRIKTGEWIYDAQR